MIKAQSFTIDEIEEITGFDRRTIAYYVQQGLLPKVGRRGPRTRYSQLFLDRLRFIRKVRDLQDQGAMGSMTLADIRDFFESVPEDTVADIVEGRRSPATIGQERPGDRSAMALPSERRKILARRIESLRQATADESVPWRLETRNSPPDRARDGSPTIQFDESSAAHACLASPDTVDSVHDRGRSSDEDHPAILDGSEHRPGAPMLKRHADALPPAEHELREALARLSAVAKRQQRAHLGSTETWTRTRINEELAFVARGLEQKHLPLLERVAQILRRLLQEGEGRM